MKFTANFIKKYILLIVLCLLCYFAVKPLFYAGFFPIHDDTQVQRVFEMKQSLADGMFPVRWVSELGYNYGYPIFNFYAPLAYYVGGMLNLFSFNALLSTKIIMLIGMSLAAIFMYLFARQFWGDRGGLIAALLYMYAPYHALDLYVRGDIAEIWAYAFIPLAFYGLWKTFTDRKWKFVLIGSLAYAAIILSHNLTAFMITPFLIIATVGLYIISYKDSSSITSSTNHKNNYYIPLILLLGIFVSAFYWLPTLLEMQFTNVLSQIGGGADFHDHYICLRQLWDSPWGYGGSARGCILDGLSFRVGKLHIVLLALSITSLIVLWKNNKSKFLVTLWFMFSFLVSVFLMLDISTPIWEAIPHMAFIQYPWRFLLLTSFFSSFLGGGVMLSVQKMLLFFAERRLTALQKKQPKNESKKEEWLGWTFTAVLSAVIIIFNTKVFVPQTALPRTPEVYTSFRYITWDTSKISDEYLMKGIHKPNNPNEIPFSKIANSNPLIKISNSTEKTQLIKAEVQAKQKTDLTLHLDYFPAWHIFIDGKQSSFKYFNKGLLITVPLGKHIVEAKFIQTSIEKIADAISLTGVLIIIIGIITTRKKNKYGKKTS